MIQENKQEHTNMRKDELIDLSKKEIQDQHDTFLVEFLGVENSGLSEQRIQELYEAGYISPTEQGLRIAGLDPIAFLMIAGKVFDDVSHDDKVKMRDWTLKDWVKPVQSKLALIVQTRGMPQGIASMGVDKPAPPMQTLNAPKNIPTWLSPAEKGAYLSALTRSGEYARGLGNKFASDLSNTIAEGWQGEEITEEINPKQREFMLSTIRNETANEMITNRDAKTLASRLADQTKFYSHNWQRIAQTELQAAHNEGRFIDAVENGDMIARVPDTDACETCLSLFVGEDGNLRVFTHDELATNGTNVGKQNTDKKATLFPVHPNCKCDTIPVPVGFYVQRDGRIRKIKKDDVYKAIKVPRKYLSGLDKETQEERKKEIQRRVKGGEEKRTYTPMKGDEDVKTKPSKYSRSELAKQVREELKTNTTEEFIRVASKISGVPKSILNEVHKRGAEAWSVGHRPGASQVAWARARVYSFLTGGKTRRTADADLWQKYKDKK